MTALWFVVLMLAIGVGWSKGSSRTKAPGRPLDLLDRLVRGVSWIQVWIPLGIAVGVVTVARPVNPMLTVAVGGLGTIVCMLSRLRTRKVGRYERRRHLSVEAMANLGMLVAIARLENGLLPSGTTDILLTAGAVGILQVTSTQLLRWPVRWAWPVAHPLSIFANGTMLVYLFLLQPSTTAAWASIVVSLTAMVTAAVHLVMDDWTLWWARIDTARNFRKHDPRYAEAWLHDETRESTGLALPHTMAELAVYDLRGDFRQKQWPPTAHAITAGKNWLATAEHLVTIAQPHVGSDDVARARAHCAFSRGQVLEAAADWEAAVAAYSAAATGYAEAGLPSIAALARLFRARLLAERLDSSAAGATERTAIAADTELVAPVRRWAGAIVHNPNDDQRYSRMVLRAGLQGRPGQADPPWLPLVTAAPPGAPAEEHEISRTRYPSTGPAQRMIDRGTRLLQRGRHAEGTQELRAAAALLENNSQQLTAMGVLTELARAQTTTCGCGVEMLNVSTRGMSGKQAVGGVLFALCRARGPAWAARPDGESERRRVGGARARGVRHGCCGRAAMFVVVWWCVYVG